MFQYFWNTLYITYDTTLETIFAMRRINEAFLEPRHEFIMDGTSIPNMKRPAREFHADLNERRDEREFKTRATDHKRDTAAATRSGRSEIDILLSGPASKFPSPPPPPFLASVLNIHQVPAFRDWGEPNFTKVPRFRQYSKII